MARPSVKAERTEEILDAFERCVARFGIEGTTLEKIAEESGLRRSLLRYHVGNREVLVDSLTDRYLSQSRKESAALLESLPETDKTQALLDYLFSASTPEDAQRILVAEALMASADLYPKIKPRMIEWYQGFVEMVQEVIETDYPKAKKDATAAVAWGVVSIVFNVQSLVPVGADNLFRKSSVDAARRLLSTL